MLKFYFVRVEEPFMSTTGPSWDHKGNDDWSTVDGIDQDDDAAEATWRWLLGKWLHAGGRRIALVDVVDTKGCQCKAVGAGMKRRWLGGVALCKPCGEGIIVLV